ncbi:MAG: hypothetical protein ACR5LD_03420 [Symbiopectobacterium sp.]
MKGHINQLNNNAIIVLHIIGSHGPAYYRHYPDAFKQFTLICLLHQPDSKLFPRCANQTPMTTHCFIWITR